jgi:hypothetical protein
MSKWITVDHSGRRATGESIPSIYPEVATCYIVFVCGKIVYVGQTVNLRNRFNNREWDIGYGVIVKYRICRRYGEWAMHEARFIRRFCPPMNTCQLSRTVRWQRHGFVERGMKFSDRVSYDPNRYTTPEAADAAIDSYWWLKKRR